MPRIFSHGVVYNPPVEKGDFLKDAAKFPSWEKEGGGIWIFNYVAFQENTFGTSDIQAVGNRKGSGSVGPAGGRQIPVAGEDAQTAGALHRIEDRLFQGGFGQDPENMDVGLQAGLGDADSAFEGSFGGGARFTLRPVVEDVGQDQR